MKVLIRFKDNDFGHVLKAFGTLLLPKVKDKDAEQPLTADAIAGWFNTIAYTLYEMTSRLKPVRENRLHMANYLKITTNDVYIDKHADEKMESAHEWSNYDSVMIDASEHATIPVYLV